jgi:hypothetical protein
MISAQIQRALKRFRPQARPAPVAVPPATSNPRPAARQNVAECERFHTSLRVSELSLFQSTVGAAICELQDQPCSSLSGGVDPNDRQEEGMCSVLLAHHYRGRKHLSSASRSIAPVLQSELPEGRARPAKLRCSGLATLLALPALVLLAGGSVAQAQEISRPTISTELRDATSVQTQATAKLSQPLPTESSFDATNLPPIASIGAGSDILPFLASGVPADVTRTALRRAWSTDPAIRDFIGLSENSWDFDARDGAPGFGSLTTDSPRQPLAPTTREGERLDTGRPAPIPTVEAVQVPDSAQVK